ncbi:MAG: HAMP domain-containing sensor histidine kinase [Opitutaceae bacterium]
MKHGLQRWQQGYRLGELMHEWGHLHLCLSHEVHAFVAAHPEIERDTLAAAHDELIDLISEGINESAGQYARMEQAEAASRVRDLQQALARAAEIERRRVELIHQAVHDLRSNVQSVGTAADVLGESNVAESDRVEMAKLIQQGVESVSAMLSDLMDLARLEAGQEKRDIALFDAAKALTELCTRNQPAATEQTLFLRTEGPAVLNVEGDAGKIGRLVQNLLVNALKYTVAGGVTVTWGEENENWWVIVKDTGPGMMAGSSAPLAAGMKEATDSARESDEKAAVDSGEAPTVLPLPPRSSAVAPRHPQQAGEGIGLSIVKRLCELLDASLELASSADAGTTFRVVFPRRYRVVGNAPAS